MRKYRGVFRIALVIFWMASFLLNAWLIMFFVRGRRRRELQIRLISYYAKMTTNSLGYEIVSDDFTHTHGSLIVANHLSYVDILCIASRSPSIFVTSTEMRDAPVLGWICRAAGCIFVNRRRHFVSRSELNEISEALSAGFRVVLFPEATSSDGSGILPFKRGLLRAAQRVGAPLVGLCLNYEEVDISTHDQPRNRICFYGDAEFGRHLWSLASSPPMRAHIQNVYTSELDAAGNLKELRHEVRSRIATYFRPLAKRNEIYWASPLPRYAAASSIRYESI